MYNTCTRKDSQNGQPWCATNVDEATKEVLLGNWGDCDRSCVASGRWPEENITISTSLTNIPKLTPSDVLYSESRYFKESIKCSYIEIYSFVIGLYLLSKALV